MAYDSEKSNRLTLRVFTAESKGQRIDSFA